MAIHPILEVPDARLRTVSKPVEVFDDALRRLVSDMFETMYDAPGIGLAAIQIGVEKRLLVIDLQEEEDEDGKPIKDPRVFINPELIEVSEEMSTYNEGCLSIPEQFAEIERPTWCVARWRDEHGKEHQDRFEGLLATCLQHEIDHLNGVLFTDHLSRLKRNMVMKRLEKMRKAAA
ncbi:peptide deformylase [Stakelama saccharophila]|uniref:Peptide deformylase n=1 Tax=Stakelama saccharophila TaxID=3075605 RepID=A0ABZ0B5J9_9SPHN|nr:peptide deformylase [Stakelama sp. W311]WNO52482.1 peptide deformylase [Stakelama sp. W311]